MSPELEKPANPETVGEIPRDAVLAALDKVVTSGAFGKTDRPARFLRHLVQTSLRGEAKFLKESVLGTEVFDRPASWDPRLDPVVRQEAARLRRRLAKYYENGGADAGVRIELPVGSYVPVFRNTSVEVQAPRVEGVAASRRLLWPYAAAAILSIALCLTAWRVTHREAAPSIVVLPFTNLSTDPASQYFSDGLTDEIIDSLARIKTLRVIARSSAFQFRGKMTDIREVGRLLNVANVLEGTVERSGDRVKIIAHLERVSDGSLIWSNAFERKASDLYAVQSELAAGIARGLKIAAGVPDVLHVPNSEAHEFVMKARYDMQEMTTESLTLAESEYQRAIDLDSQYAGAYLGLASAKYNQVLARGSTYRPDAERSSATHLFHKALELDPDLPAAHATLAALAMQYDWDWDRAERELLLAEAGPPSPSTENFYASFLIFHGRFAEADAHLRRYEELDPFSTITLINIAGSRNIEGRFIQAREISEKAALQHPNAIAPQQLIGFTYVEEGHPEFALPIFRQLKERFPPAEVCEAMAHAKAGRREEARRLIRPFEDKFPNPGVAMQWFALVYAFMGDEPNTVKWLKRSADLHEWQVLNVGVNPVYRAMRNSAGFQAVENRIGLGGSDQERNPQR